MCRLQHRYLPRPGTVTDEEYWPRAIVTISRPEHDHPPRGIKVMELKYRSAIASIYVVYETVDCTQRIPGLLFTLDTSDTELMGRDGAPQPEFDRLEHVYRQYQKYDDFNMRRTLNKLVDSGATVRAVHEVLGGHKEMSKSDIDVLTDSIKRNEFDRLCRRHGERYIT